MKARKKLWFNLSVLLGAMIISFSSCENEDVMSDIPVLSTIEVTGINQTSAISGGNISNDGGAEIIAKGICWSTNETPTIKDSKTVNNNDDVKFTSFISGLEPNTTYNVRAYAINSVGTGYGNSISFTTNEKENINLATLSTIEVTSITKISAISGGNIVDDGGALVTIRGICWSTNEIPTLNDNFTENGWGIGNFTGNLASLEPNSTYYIRAYAINSAGTSYGNAISFKTDNYDVPTLTTNDITEINQTTAVSGGNIINNGGAAIIACGICWSTSETPTINDNKTDDGLCEGGFTSNITGLEPNTIYYVRAYATNSAGTGYGNMITFETIPADVIVAIDGDGNVYETITIGNQVWIAENLRTTKFNDGTSIPLATTSAVWSTLFTPGYCWYSNDAEYNGKTYGALYNWYAVETGKLCPSDWHVPTDEEWTELTSYIGSDPGSKLKATSGWNNEGNGTDEYGFKGLPSGNREPYGGYRNMGETTNWWSSTERDTDRAWYRNATAPTTGLYRVGNSKQLGLPVRCIRNR